MHLHCQRSSVLVAFVAVLLSVGVTRVVGAQVGSTTDIITGKITSPDGKPIVGARVDATSIETGVTRSRTTNDRGQYTILFPDGGGSYRVSVRYLGYAPATFTLARQADEDRLVADIRMDPVAAQLGPVVVRSSAPTGQGDRPGPGSVERTLTRRAADTASDRPDRPCGAGGADPRRRCHLRLRFDGGGVLRRRAAP